MVVCNERWWSSLHGDEVLCSSERLERKTIGGLRDIKELGI
jgi:hypothetical protein